MYLVVNEGNLEILDTPKCETPKEAILKVTNSFKVNFCIKIAFYYIFVQVHATEQNLFNSLAL